jgi:hypothetical protein
MTALKMRLAAVGMAAALAMAAGSARAQAGGGPGGGPGGGFNFDPSAIRERMEQQFQQQIEASDEEWRVIEPRFIKVLVLQMDTGTGIMGALRGAGRGRGGGAGGATINTFINQIFGITEPSTVSRRLDELQQAIDNNASADLLKDKLEALRMARQKAKVDLAKAQDDLIQVLSLRQEALLVQMGLLE